MEYVMSNEAMELLNRIGKPTSILFNYYINRYFATGEEPTFTSTELTDMWFYLKMHELGTEVGKCFGYKTFSFIELCSDLNANCKKFESRNYRLKKRKKL